MPFPWRTSTKCCGQKVCTKLKFIFIFPWNPFHNSFFVTMDFYNLRIFFFLLKSFMIIFRLGSCPTQDFLCPGTHLHILFVLTTNPESNFVEIIQHSTHKLWLVFIPKHHCHMVVAQLLDPLHFKMIWFYLMKSVLTLPIYYCYKNCCWYLEINCSWSCLSFFKHTRISNSKSIVLTVVISVLIT